MIPEMKYLLRISTLILALVSVNCSSVNYSGGASYQSGGPTVAERDTAIKSEPLGSYYIARRYYVEKTRFWGYVRKPRQPWSKAKLVLIDESKKLAPDRFPENGKRNKRYGFDNNYEYQFFGSYTGEIGYDPNSNQELPIFKLKDYKLANSSPGWLFSPSDQYDPNRITIRP